MTPVPGATETPPATEPANPSAVAPTEEPASIATSEAAGPVSELPGTGGSPERDSGQGGLWLVLALLAASGLGIVGVRAYQRREKPSERPAKPMDRTLRTANGPAPKPATGACRCLSAEVLTHLVPYR